MMLPAVTKKSSFWPGLVFEVVNRMTTMVATFSNNLHVMWSKLNRRAFSFNLSKFYETRLRESAQLQYEDYKR